MRDEFLGGTIISDLEEDPAKIWVDGHKGSVAVATQWGDQPIDQSALWGATSLDQVDKLIDALIAARETAFGSR